MENDLVVGILNIVEDKLREFGVMLPDDDREESNDPIVGYHYAELHDRIKEYLEEKGLVKTDSFLEPTEALKRLFVLTCVHDTKYGPSHYGSVHPSYEAALSHVDAVKEECDLDEENDQEFFDFDIFEEVLDVNRLAPALPLSITGKEMNLLADRGASRMREQAKVDFKSLDSQILFAEASKAPEKEDAGTCGEHAREPGEYTPDI